MNQIPLKALVVLDEPQRGEQIRAMMASSLPCPPICAIASSLSEALALSDSGSWDVALTRLRLPDTKGLEALVRFHLARRDLPVIALLDDEEPTVVLEAAQSLADDCLFLNDLDSTRLVESIACVLDRRELLMQLKASGKASAPTDSLQLALLDRLDQAVFVVAKENGELLYRNAVADSWFGDAIESALADCLEYGLLEGEDLEIETAAAHPALPHAELRSSCLEWAGRPACLITLRNIAKRKRAEEAFLSSQRRLDLAVKASNVGLWSWDLRAGQIQFSDRCKRMLGYECAEFPDTIAAFRGALHPDDRRRVAEYFKRYFREPWSAFECEYRMRRKDGTYASILCRGELYSDKEGALAKMSGAHVDISARLAAASVSRVEERPLGRPVALLADDDDILRGAIRSMLEGFGYETLVASDGIEALNRFAEAGEGLQIALLDCNMPGLDGGEVFRRIRGVNAALPIVLMSGNEDEVSLALDRLDPRRCRFLQKPFGMSTLRRLLGELLEAEQPRSSESLVGQS